MKDTRVLCRKCADNYKLLGYILLRRNDIKDTCFKCNSLGFEYRLKKPKQRGGKIGK